MRWQKDFGFVKRSQRDIGIEILNKSYDRMSCQWLQNVFHFLLKVGSIASPLKVLPFEGFEGSTTTLKESYCGKFVINERKLGLLKNS